MARGGGFGPDWRNIRPDRVVGGTLSQGSLIGGSDSGGSHPGSGGNDPVLTDKKGQDRGSKRGAKRFVVVGTTLYTKALADQQGIRGIFFQSGKEAKRWISLLILEEAGRIRKLRRQIRFPLEAKRPDGLMEIVARYIADFVYEEQAIDSCSGGRIGNATVPPHAVGDWVEVVEDTKPSGTKLVHGKRVPFREEVYALKKRWFEVQYGKTIRET